jgi:hypothetical protein
MTMILTNWAISFSRSAIHRYSARKGLVAKLLNLNTCITRVLDRVLGAFRSVCL